MVRAALATHRKQVPPGCLLSFQNNIFSPELLEGRRGKRSRRGEKGESPFYSYLRWKMLGICLQPEMSCSLRALLMGTWIQSSDPGPAPSTFHPFSYDPVSEKFSDEAVEFPSMSCGDLVRSRRKRYQTGWRGSGGVAQERRAFPESSRSPVRPPASKQRNWSWSYDCAPTLNCFFFHIFLFFFLNHLICGFFFF